MDHDEPSKHRVLTLLNSLKQASKDLQIKTNPFTFLFKADSKAAIEALLELESKAITIFSSNPNLYNLSQASTLLLNFLFLWLRKKMNPNLSFPKFILTYIKFPFPNSWHISNPIFSIPQHKQN